MVKDGADLGMPGHAVVRLPGSGTLLGEVVARHPSSLVTCVGLGRHSHASREVLDHLALLEGIPDHAVAQLLLAWARRYGEPPQVLGGPFALRLPVDLGLRHTHIEAACLRIGGRHPAVRMRLSGEALELWVPCASAAEASQVLGSLRELLHGIPVLSMFTADPQPEDVLAWSLLQEAAQSVVPDCLVAS